MENSTEKYSLEDKINSDGIIAFSDTHGNYRAMNNVFEYAKKNNLTVAIGGDIINDYGLLQAANDMDYKSAEQHFMEYASQKLDQKDLETYFISRNVEEYGLEAMLNQIPLEHKLEAKKNIEERIKYSKTDIFNKKKENLEKGFEQEVAYKAQEDTAKLQLTYQVFMDEEAKRFADLLNKYSNVSVTFTHGNHENVLFVEQVRQYLENPNQIIDLTNKEGLTYIKQSNGEEISIAGMTNCAQTMPYLNMIFSQEQVAQLMSHMGIDQIKYETLLQGDVSKEQLFSLEDKILQDYDIQRIGIGKNDEIDVFMSHGQIGTPKINGKEGYNIPYFGSAAYLAQRAKITLEGHIHGNIEGEYSSGGKMARIAGENALIIKKSDNGELEKEWKSIYDGTFDGNHNNEIPYDLTYLKDKVESLYSELTSTSDDSSYEQDSSSSAKAA